MPQPQFPALTKARYGFPKRRFEGQVYGFRISGGGVGFKVQGLSLRVWICWKLVIIGALGFMSLKALHFRVGMKGFGMKR